MVKTRKSRNEVFAIENVAITVASSVFLASCGGGGGGGSTQSAGIGGTGIVAGKTTGFGSIYVNGSRYTTPVGIPFIVDGDDTATEGDLAVGMYVRLRVKTLDGVFTGEALEVIYDDEIEGPVSAAPVLSLDGTQKTFDVFGQTITVEDISTIFKGTAGNPNFGFDTIEADDVVEISGFRTSPTAINATYVEFKGDLVLMSSEVELRGEIQNLTGVHPNHTFEIDGVEITTNDPNQIEVSGGLVNTLNVEVKGIIQTQGLPDTVLASKVKLDDDDFDDDVDDIKLQGVVSGFTDINSNFFIDSQEINASMAQLEPLGLQLMNGMDVEVEGKIEGGILKADEVESEEEGPKLRSYVDTVDTLNSEFEVHYPVTVGPMTITVHVDSQTHFVDETGAATPPFTIDDLNQGLTDFVRVEGVEIANNEILATVVKRTTPDDKLELEGEVDGYNAGANITVLGIQYQLDGSTSYEPNPPDIEVGDFVEIEDDDDPLPNQADGIADEVEEE
jgi:hypothetical protein